MESSSPKTWYLLGGVLLAGFSALCVGAVAVFLIKPPPEPSEPSELALASLAARSEMVETFGPPPMLVLRLPDASPLSAAGLERVAELAARIDRINGVAHVDSLDRRLSLRSALGFIEARSLSDLATEEPEGSSLRELIETTVVGRPLVSPDGAASYLFVTFASLDPRELDRIGAEIAESAPSVTSYETWRDPQSAAFPATASVYVSLEGRSGLLDLLHCAASIADAVEPMAGVRATASPVDLVEVAGAQLRPDQPPRPVETMSRREVAQLMLLAEMTEMGFIEEHLNFDRTAMLVEVAMDGDIEAISAVRAAASAVACPSVELEIL